MLAADVSHPRFAASGEFHRDLKARVDAWFRASQRSERDAPAMYLKTALILAWFAASWALLVFGAGSVVVAAIGAASLGLAIAAVGMSVMHDANHGSYSRRAWVNGVFGWTVDALGASSYVWKVKHNAVHHTWTNIGGEDDDLDMGLLARLSPEQASRPWHRFQHLYVWVLYGLLMPKWVLYDDFANLAHGRVGHHALQRPNRRQWLLLVAGKLTFFGWAIVVPALFHPLWLVVLAAFATLFVTGVTLAVTFQLAHCVEEATFPLAPASGRMSSDWAEHQLETTVDFARGNPLLTWFMGGLNFQVEHHLFPKVCHVHYPALARIVEATARDHGLRYRATRSLHAAVRSHFRVLRRLAVA